jgi:hypothetical protein
MSPSTSVASRFGRADGAQTGGEPSHRPFEPSSFVLRRSRFNPANDNRQPLGSLIRRYAMILLGVLLLGGLTWLALR